MFYTQTELSNIYQKIQKLDIKNKNPKKSF